MSEPFDDPLTLPVSGEGPLEEIGRTARGYTIWRQRNGAGGHTYWSDSIGGGVVIYDSCLASEEEVLFCLEADRKLRAEEKPEKPAGPVTFSRVGDV